MSILPGATRKSFAGRDLRHRTLDRHSFKLCDFRDADLRGASLRGVSLAGCNLQDADLRDTDLSYARFSYVMTHDPEYGLLFCPSLSMPARPSWRIGGLDFGGAERPSCR
ncbi:pentapeptide repeat-containing protein [Micromonospora soli]|uniref:pentapeptide repeat-containing protein n=1 Tax=Micromonospora sp. NBRC 110009 TaxID=3061627 RepID=UPI002671EC01|nr:pentapeptide repeat-containing protein [Micromonospora sp. NBRC 110009]WKT97498.1 pentapeptide repeat-containing protein [Micromonospora sp. NBRC 110009]